MNKCLFILNNTTTYLTYNLSNHHHLDRCNI